MEQDGSEAALRSAISRAYYAAHCRSRNHLRDRENHKIPEWGNVHRWVIDRFHKSPDIVHRGIGEDLFFLRAERNRADYEDSVPGLVERTKAALMIYERVLRTLASL